MLKKKDSCQNYQSQITSEIEKWLDLRVSKIKQFISEWPCFQGSIREKTEGLNKRSEGQNRQLRKKRNVGEGSGYVLSEIKTV